MQSAVVIDGLDLGRFKLKIVLANTSSGNYRWLP